MVFPPSRAATARSLATPRANAMNEIRRFVISRHG